MTYIGLVLCNVNVALTSIWPCTQVTEREKHMPLKGLRSGHEACMYHEGNAEMLHMHMHKCITEACISMHQTVLGNYWTKGVHE